LEFFREAASGYDVNAYFLAVHIMSTLEHFAQATLAAIAAYWIRDSLVAGANYLVAFLMMTWLCVSWALLFPLIVAPKNVVVVTGFFMAFFGILFSGGLAPVTYEGKVLARRVLSKEKTPIVLVSHASIHFHRYLQQWSDGIILWVLFPHTVLY